MTIASQVASNNDVVDAWQIDRRFSLVVLAVEELVVLDEDVVCLIKLDQVKAIVVLQRIIGSRATAGRALVVDLAIANRDVTGPQIAVVPRCCISAGRIVCLNVVVLLFGVIHAVAMNPIASQVQPFSGSVAMVRVRNDVEPVDNDS